MFRYQKQKTDSEDVLPAVGSTADVKRRFETQQREQKMEKRLSFTPEKGGAAAKAAMFEQGQIRNIRRYKTNQMNACFVSK